MLHFMYNLHDNYCYTEVDTVKQVSPACGELVKSKLALRRVDARFAIWS